MSDHLIVRLPATAQASLELVRVDAAASGHGGEPLDPSQPPPIGENTSVVAIVPAEHVLLREARVPVKGSARILQTVPFALEEHLAEDVADLHFAIGARGRDGQVPVAAVARERMAAWMESLAELGLSPKTMYCDANLLHPPARTVMALIEGDRLLLVSATAQPPVALDVDNLAMALEALLAGGAGDARTVSGAAAEAADGAEEDTAAAPDAGPRPGEVDEGPAPDPAESVLLIYASAEDLARHHARIDALTGHVGRIERREIRGGATVLLAEQAAQEGTAINLLQGPFAPPSQLGALWRQWRVAAVLLGLCLLTLVGGKSARLAQLSAQQAQLDAEIGRVLLETCPQERTVVDAQRQMQRCVAGALPAGTEGELFLAMLGTLSGALRDTPNTRIEELRFSRQRMTLKLMAPSVDSVEQVKSLVADRGGLDLTIEQINPQPDEVEFRVQLSRPVA